MAKTPDTAKPDDYDPARWLQGMMLTPEQAASHRSLGWDVSEAIVVDPSARDKELQAAWESARTVLATYARLAAQVAFERYEVTLDCPLCYTVQSRRCIDPAALEVLVEKSVNYSKAKIDSAIGLDPPVELPYVTWVTSIFHPNKESQP